MVDLVFASPRKLPEVASLRGRVVFVDIAFAATVGASVSYELTTLPVIEGLGSRLAAWVDHHDHERHHDWSEDPRFVLRTKAQHGGCPELVTPALVAQIGSIDTICAHIDVDGLYSAAKWLLNGNEPYRGADDDARAIDTRVGEATPTAQRIDMALRARSRDDGLRRAVVAWLVGGLKADRHDDLIGTAANEFTQRLVGTRELATRFQRRGRLVLVDAVGFEGRYDKTELLLMGQGLADIAVVKDSGTYTIAAAFHSGWDFVELLGLKGGMPTRVAVPAAMWKTAETKLLGAAQPTPRAPSQLDID